MGNWIIKKIDPNNQNQKSHKIPVNLKIIGVRNRQRIEKYWSWVLRNQVTGEFEEPIPVRGDDGAGSPDHHPRQIGIVRIPGEHYACPQILHALQALWGATYQTGIII